MGDVTCLNNICLDKALYKLSKKTLFGCNISPNVITSINVFVITPLILLNLFYKKGYFPLLLLCIIRVYLDILDGSIARRCNMKSNFGLLYDFIGDYINSFGVLIIILYYMCKYKKLSKLLTFIVAIIIFIVFFQFLNGLKQRVNNMNNKNYSTKDKQTKNLIRDKLDTIITDNTIIMFPLFIVWAKLFISYLSN